MAFGTGVGGSFVLAGQPGPGAPPCGRPCGAHCVALSPTAAGAGAGLRRAAAPGHVEADCAPGPAIREAFLRLGGSPGRGGHPCGLRRWAHDGDARAPAAAVGDAAAGSRAGRGRPRQRPGPRTRGGVRRPGATPASCGGSRWRPPCAGELLAPLVRRAGSSGPPWQHSCRGSVPRPLSSTSPAPPKTSGRQHDPHAAKPRRPPFTADRLVPGVPRRAHAGSAHHRSGGCVGGGSAAQRP